jgi:hypothetical protein
MQFTADDGTPLEVKEAAVIDSDGQVLKESPEEPGWGSGRASSSGWGGGARVFRVSGWMMPVFVVLGLLILSLGAVFFVGFLLVAFGVTLLKKVLRSLGVGL